MTAISSFSAVTSLVTSRSRTFRTPAPDLSDERVGSPLWWVYRLSHRLELETVGEIRRLTDGTLISRPGLAKLDRYYRGHHDLPFVRDEDRAEFQTMLSRSVANLMRLVVDAEAERINWIGLRLPGDDEPADSTTWEMWQRNGVELWWPTAVRTALSQRRSFLSVWWEDGKAKITLEDPQQVIVEHAPGDRTDIVAGLKLFTDDWTGDTLANLALKDRIYRFRWGTPAGGHGPVGWYQRQEPEVNKLGEVPYVPVVNRPDIWWDGFSEIEDLIGQQDQLNQTEFHRQVAEYLSAFKQKWAVGLEIPEDADGNPIETFKAAIDRLWVSEDPGSKFGEFEATDLDNYHQTESKITETVSILSRTPRHVFMHQGQAPSGDAMKSDEAGLVAKVKGTFSPFGWAVKRTSRLARKIEGHATPVDAEVVWADPEFQTLGQLVDAQVKMVQTKMSSLSYAREKIGMTPATIKRVEAEIIQEAMLADLMAPAVTETVPVAPDADDAV